MKDIELIEFLKSQVNSQRNKGFSYLIDQYFDTIKGYVIQNSGSEDDAKDVFQEGLIALISNLNKNKFQGKSALKSYLFSICKNLWLQKIRKEKKTENIKSLEEVPYEETDKDDKEKMFEAMQHQFKKLGGKCQQILIEFYYKKHSIKKLQEIYGLGSAQAAKNKKSRCLKKLSEMVNMDSV